MTDSKDNTREPCVPRASIWMGWRWADTPRTKGVNWGQGDGHRNNRTADLRHWQTLSHSWAWDHTAFPWSTRLALCNDSTLAPGAEGMKTQRCVQEDLPWNRLLEVSTQMPCSQQSAKLDKVITSTSEDWASAASLEACASAEPSLGGWRAFVLHTSPSSWWF